MNRTDKSTKSSGETSQSVSSPSQHFTAQSASKLLLRHADNTFFPKIRNSETLELSPLGQYLMTDPSEFKAKTASEDQVKFLVSCIKYSADGKVHNQIRLKIIRNRCTDWHRFASIGRTSPMNAEL